MNEEYEALQKIREEISKEDVPDAIRPENIDNLLVGVTPKKKWYKRWQTYTLAAAAAVAIVTVPVYMWMNQPGNNVNPTAYQKEIDEVFDGALYAARDYNEVHSAVAKVKRAQQPSVLDYFDGFMIKDYAEERIEVYEESVTAGEDATKDADFSDTKSNSAASDFSYTNLREVGIDEGDIVKTDGDYIYSFNADNEVRIVKVDGASLELLCVYNEDYDSMDYSINDMFINGEQLILITDSYDVSYDYSDERDYYVDEKDTTKVVILDISDRENPKNLSISNVEGEYDTSRILDGYLYLFTWYGGEDIPKIYDEYPEASDILLAKKMDSYTTFTMTSISLKEGKNLGKLVSDKVIYMDTSDVYVASDGIYIQGQDYSQSRNHTNILKFAYEKGNFTPKGIGSVPGSLESSFSIDEGKDGVLRVATTVWGNSDWMTGVYIFDDKMKSLGRLTGLAKGEEIKAARYIGDMLYLVTYENTDPVFSIDLSDASEPKLIGELQIPGFSDYLHPWDDTHLLGIGYETDPDTSEVKGIKLTMFDISDPENVKEEKTTVITLFDEGEYDYVSREVPGLTNYKAMLISPEKNLIGFGADIYATRYLDYNTYYYEDEDPDTTISEVGDEYPYSSEEFRKSAYYVFSYSKEEGFTVRLEQDSEVNSYVNNMRGLYINDNFYVVDNDVIKAYDMSGDNFVEAGKTE